MHCDEKAASFGREGVMLLYCYIVLKASDSRGLAEAGSSTYFILERSRPVIAWLGSILYAILVTV